MDIKKLIEQLSARGLNNGSSLGYHSGLYEEAAAAITDLLVENQSLRNAANDFKARAEAAEARAEKAERERDEAVETIFKWTGCAECKHWQSDTDWCEKHDRYATMSDGCTTPEWRGIKED